MPGDLKIDTLLDALVLVIPAALLLTIILLLIVKRARRKVPEAAPEVPKQTAYSIAQPVVAAAPPPPVSAEALKATPPESAEDVTVKIEQALTDGSKLSLSGLYFDLAAAHAREGNANARMAALRSAAGYGALHGPPSAHARARMALAEDAFQAGDLTSACEQWQLARTAYLAGGDAERHASVEKRMRDNGCPTDWVLTDF